VAELDKLGENLLALLVRVLPHANPKDPRTFITYKGVHTQLGLPLHGHWGRSLKHQGLLSLANWTKSENKPAITGLIVSDIERTPGKGYFNLFEKSEIDFDWWADQIRLSKEFDWTPYLPDTELPSRR
jgi:hypothetical protein